MNTLLKEKVLTEEGLTTLMSGVESIINSRPLTKVSDDPRDLEAPTPNHLQGGSVFTSKVAPGTITC